MVDLTYLAPILFEIIVAIILTFVTFSAVHRWIQKKNDITKKLATFLIIYWITFVISLINQINRNMLDFALIAPDPSEIVKQVYLISVFIANWIFYLLFLSVFSDKTDEKPNKMFKFFTIGSVTFVSISLVNPGLLIIGNVLIILHAIVLYFPATIKSYKTFKRIDETDEGRYAMLSIALMSFFFLLGWIFIVANTIWELIYNVLYGPLFYACWTIMLIAVLCGYIGYIFPNTFRKWIKNTKK